MPVAAPPPPPVEIDDGVIEEARRRQRRRRAALAGLLTMSLLLGAGLGLVIGGGGGSPRQAARRPSPSHAASTQPGRGSSSRNPWLAYETSVLPGGGLQLGSARTGFELAPTPVPGMDENLATPGGMDLAWPSPSVLVSHDAGRQWRPSLSAPAGFWGLSVLNATHAWAVGVTGLYRTVDSGIRWQRVGEATRPLVRVAFADPTHGLGLTVSGRLVASRDGGRSWQASRWRGRGTALCTPSPGLALVSGQTGAIWRSANGGTSWQRAAAGFKPVESYGPYWYGDLSCQGANDVEFSQTFCQAACAGGVKTSVRQSTDGGLTWRTIARQATLNVTATTHPHMAAHLPLDRTVAVGARGACLASNSYDVPAAAIEITCTADGRHYAEATLPGLPLSAAHSTIVIQGIDFTNTETGWLMVDQYTQASSPHTAHATTEIWATNDGGRTWTPSFTTPTHHL